MPIKHISLFLLAGGIAATLNFGSRFIFSVFLPLEVAVILAFGVGMFSGFLLMRVFVFNGVLKPIAPQAAKFIGINLLALAQTLIVTLFMASWLLPKLGVIHHVDALAHLTGVLVPAITSYFAHKLWTFR